MSISNQDLLRHILDEAQFLLKSTSGITLENLVDDPILSRAVIRSREIIGEASKKVEDSFKEKHPEIEWKKMAGTRDRLIHDYFSADYEILWDVFEHKLPDLQRSIQSILNTSL